MATEKRLCYVHELVPGMILSQEIRANGVVLIGKGVAITEAAINKLKECYIAGKIEIYYENEEAYRSRAAERIRTVEEVEETLSDLTFDSEAIFNNIESIRTSGIEEIRTFATKIQDELKSTSSVVKNIVLYGSGADCIYRHSVNVAALSTILGKWIGLSGSDLNLLTYSAILHDFGKTKIGQDIIGKIDSLTDKEFKEIKNHATIGYNYIKEIRFLDKSVSFGVLMHHERMDGSGYPLGLKEEQIHNFAKIIGIADVFDAVNSDRSYKKKRGPFEALEIIKKESLGRLSYEYCNIFINHIINYYMGESVVLNNGKVCKIIQIDANNLNRPLILDETEFLDMKKHQELYIENLVL